MAQPDAKEQNGPHHPRHALRKKSAGTEFDDGLEPASAILARYSLDKDDPTEQPLAASA